KKISTTRSFSTYFNEDEKNEIQEIESAWIPGNSLSPVEEDRLLLKLKEAALRSKKKKDSKITFRLPKDDLIGLKAKDRQSGIDYQPLPTVIIHKYVKNEIKLEL
ncbi:MAG: hypothetical protein L3J12_03260, partial [Spirochaetales bacterium]|nr:hypothetical protein [Spirochaetales bacterium]